MFEFLKKLFGRKNRVEDTGSPFNYGDGDDLPTELPGDGPDSSTDNPDKLEGSNHPANSEEVGTVFTTRTGHFAARRLSIQTLGGSGRGGSGPGRQNPLQDESDT